MQKESRTVCFDPDLGVEAYSFTGIMQKFPNHFHEHYVIGFIENGQRYLSCNNRGCMAEAGDVLLFNPGDSHACETADARPLDYRCINIRPEVMRKAALEICGREYLPYFAEPVLYRSDLVSSLRELHTMLMQGNGDFKKEELFLFILEQLITEYAGEANKAAIQEPASEIKTICDYLESHYEKNIALADLCALTGLSRYYLVRSFTKQKGISPYSYLETVRIGRAKELLERGVCPLEAALQTGFTDQSHFTNFFKRLIGLTPRQYMNMFAAEPKKTGEET